MWKKSKNTDSYLLFLFYNQSFAKNSFWILTKQEKEERRKFDRKKNKERSGFRIWLLKIISNRCKELRSFNPQQQQCNVFKKAFVKPFIWITNKRYNCVSIGMFYKLSINTSQHLADNSLSKFQCLIVRIAQSQWNFCF